MSWSDITMGFAIFGLVLSACSPFISALIEYRSKLKIAKFSHFSKCRSEAASQLLFKFGGFRLQPAFYRQEAVSALYAYSLYASSAELPLIRVIVSDINSDEFQEAFQNFDKLQQCMTVSTERLYRLDPRRKKPY